jgi:amidophosphoribosyltransferase
MGKKLAERIKVEIPDEDIDVVIPIPESSITSGTQVARTLNKDLAYGFVKNRYVGRTFIMPEQQLRKASVRRKLNPINDEFKDKKVLLVDDSIVRGTTMKEIVAMCYKAGAKKVSVASAAAKVCFPNVYGIDMAAKKDLIASSRTNDEIKDFLGCDNLVYQSLEDLEESVLELNSDLNKVEKSIFNGVYPTDISSDYLEKLEVKRG